MWLLHICKWPLATLAYIIPFSARSPVLLIKVSLLSISSNYHCPCPYQSNAADTPFPSLNAPPTCTSPPLTTDETSVILMPLHANGHHHPLAASHRVPVALTTIGNAISQPQPENLDVGTMFGTNCLSGQVVWRGHEVRHGALFPGSQLEPRQSWSLQCTA